MPGDDHRSQCNVRAENGIVRLKVAHSRLWGPSVAVTGSSSQRVKMRLGEGAILRPNGHADPSDRRPLWSGKVDMEPDAPFADLSTSPSWLAPSPAGAVRARAGRKLPASPR